MTYAHSQRQGNYQTKLSGPSELANEIKNMKCQAVFALKKKKKRMSSAVLLYARFMMIKKDTVDSRYLEFQGTH